MTREERISAIVEVIQQEVYASIGMQRRERFATVLHRLAPIVLDLADSTREPCTCRQCHLDRLANGGGLDG
jgi:hypothetical protein